MASCQSIIQNAGFSGALHSCCKIDAEVTRTSKSSYLNRRLASHNYNNTNAVLNRRSSYSGRGMQISVSRGGVERSLSQRGGLQIRAAKRKDKERSLVLTATLIAEEGKEEEVRQLCRGVVEHFRPMVADTKSPIRAFECNQDAYEPNVYHFWERYDGYVQMNDVHAGPEHSEFMEKVRPLLKGPVALAAYEWVNGQLGHMMNPIGPKGEGGLDDATGQGGSGGGANYKQTAQTDLGNIERESWGMENMQKGIDKFKNMLKPLENLIGAKK